jgi:hypothetical protein
MRSRGHSGGFFWSRFAKFLLILYLAILGALALTTSAGAYFSSLGTGTGSVAVATLNPPTNVIATFPDPTVRAVDVTWSAPNEPAGITLDGYYVQRYLGVTASPACGTSPTDLISTVTCDDTDVASGTYTYTVTAVFRSWTATSAPSGTVTVPAATLGSLVLVPSTSMPQAGMVFTVQITAFDQYGEVDTGYTGPECLTFSGPSISVDDNKPSYPPVGSCASGSSVTFIDGVATGANSPSITLFDDQMVTLTATDNPSGIAGTTDLTILPGPISTFDVANPGTQTVGDPFSVTITALDAYGNVATGYFGDEILTFSGPSPSPNLSKPAYPSPVSFIAGVGTASNITLVDAQTTMLTATQGSITGTSSSFLVRPGPASYYTVSAPSTATTGVPFPVTVTVFDSYGNVATGYDGTADLTSSIGDVLPTSVTLANGMMSFNATLDTAGIQTITATDSVNSGITGTSGPIDVTSNAPTTYTVTYNANGATSGLPPVDGTAYSPGQTVTVLGNTGDLAEAGETFVGWNTQSNGLGISYVATNTFSIEANTILYATFSKSLAITTKFLAGATAGETNYSQTLQGTGGTLPYTWSIWAGVLPKGLSLNPSTGLISGPVSPSATTETFTVTLTDANGASTTKQFTITVCSSLAITTKFLAGATAGETNYSQTLQGTGGTLPYTWSIWAGVLPQGLSLNPSTGLISGTVSRTARTETFTVKLTDANGAWTTKQFTIAVNCRPVFTCGNSGRGQWGHFFSFQFSAWGGPQPWFTVTGQVPSWLHFDASTGVISGTPGSGQAGSYSFTVTATNSWGSQSQTFGLTITG